MAVNVENSLPLFANFHNSLTKNLLEATNNTFLLLKDYQRSLVKHLGDLAKLNLELTKSNPNLMTKLIELERDICHIRNYYDQVCSSILTVVEYGARESGCILKLIEGEDLKEAAKEIKSFLYYLKILLVDVESNMKAMEEDCPNLDDELQKNEEMRFSLSKLGDDIKKDANWKLVKLGVSTFICYATATVAGTIITSSVPFTSSIFVNCAAKVTCVPLLFYSKAGFQAAKESFTSINEDTKIKLECGIGKLTDCLCSFFKQVSNYKKNIDALMFTIKRCNSNIDAIMLEISKTEGEHLSTSSRKGYIYVKMESLFKRFEKTRSIIQDEEDGIQRQDYYSAIEKL